MLLGAMVLALVSLACGRVAEPAGDRESSADEATEAPVDRVDERTVAIYEAVIRYMNGTETWYDHLFVHDRPCEGVFEAGAKNLGPCEAPLTAGEQAALLEALADLPPLEFVSDPDPIVDRIFEASGDSVGDAVIRFGPIESDGEQVEVEASAYCGGLCGHWITLGVERSGSEWEVTGHTGPVAVA
jgi:hypothetical protein